MGDLRFTDEARAAAGFFPRNSPDSNGERYLRQLASLTGGSFQIFDADMEPTSAAKIYSPDSGCFIPYDLSVETESNKAERLWAEEQFRAKRKANLR